MEFHNVKIALIELASKLFTYNEKKLTGDVDLKGKFDYIKYDVHGAGGFSPKEQFKLGNLNYNRDEQGRDYLSSFLTLAIQCGVKLGFDQKQKEVDEIKERLERSDNIHEMYNKELSKVQKQLSENIMPKGTLEDEIRDLRKQVMELKKDNIKLSHYKNIVDTMKKSLSFVEKL